MLTYIGRYAFLVLFVVVATASAAMTFRSHQSGREFQPPKTVAELVGRLKERDPDLHIVGGGENPEGLENGAYVADHPITNSVRILTLYHPEYWAGIVLIRPGTGSEYRFPPTLPKECILATEDFFLIGDPLLIAKVRKVLEG